MPRKIRELKAALRQAGFTGRAGKGSHTVWTHRLLPDSLTLSGADGDDAHRYQEMAVRRLVEQLEREQNKL